jgi:signal transduction histidine kinase
MIRPLPRLGLRARLVLATGLITVLFAVCAGVGFRQIMSWSLEREAASAAQVKADTALSTLSVVGGKLVVGDSPGDEALDSSVWVFQDGRVVAGPREAGATAVAAATDLAGAQGRKVLRLGDGSAVVAAAPFRLGEQPHATVVAIEPLGPYERTEQVAVSYMGVLALLFVAGSMLLANVLVRRALHPVVVMSRTADEWRAHDLDRRFGLGLPHDELTQLSATLDGMLAKISGVIRHERLLTAQIAHELRTPLAALVAEAEAALVAAGPSESAESLITMRGESLRLSGVIDTLLAASGADEPEDVSADLREVVAAAVAATRHSPGSIATQVLVDGLPTGVTLGVGVDLGARILVPLLDNAARFARSRVEVTAETDGDGLVRIDIRDDGPGLALDERERVFAPGYRASGDDHGLAHQGSGLGLPLARRLAHSAGGEVWAEPTLPGTGAWLCVELPTATNTRADRR